MRCELLSKFYLWHIGNNLWSLHDCATNVVNCFQNFIFDILETTQVLELLSWIELWIAFKILSLTYWKQHNDSPKIHPTVVNCFQNFIFDILETTDFANIGYEGALWIAFKILSLTYWKQRTWIKWRFTFCCELLSKFYLWHIGNNQVEIRLSNLEVVNCFQNFIFDILETTCKILSKWQSRCELLSKFYLWHIGNNADLFDMCIELVVNCFQNFIFDILETT